MKSKAGIAGLLGIALMASLQIGVAAEAPTTSTAVVAKERKAVWHDNFKAAKKEADQTGLPILLLYTAPGWCGPCRMLETNVLASAEFKAFANGNLVLLEADFSEEKDLDVWMAENKDVADKYKLEYYPMMYFLKADLGKLGLIGGYEPEWNTKKYLEEIGKTIHPPAASH